MKKPLTIEDIKFKEHHVTFATKVPTQVFGNVEIGRYSIVEVAEGQDIDEVDRVVREKLQQQVRETLAPISAAIHKTQITPLLAHLPEQMRKDLESKIGTLYMLNALEIAAGLRDK